MTRQELASLIAKHEGKKVQVPIGNVREVLRILNQMLSGKYEKNYQGGISEIYDIEAMDVLKALLK